MTNMSEAYGKAMICDVIVSVSRRAHEKAGGWGRLYVAKNRAGRDGLVYPIKINTARSKFEIVGESDAPDMAAMASPEDEQKKAILARWRELKKDFKSPTPDTV